jgi:hypothetical protein
MDNTANLTLPYIMAAQAQKHVTHNEAIRALDTLVQMMVLDKDLSTPPGSPSEGQRYIVAASPTGAWSGQAGKVAAYQDGAWAFYAPREGWLAWVADQNELYVHDGSAWTAFASGGLGNVVDDTTPQLGGDLGTNGHNIQFADNTGVTDDSGNEQLIFQKTASAVNQWEMTNAVAGAGPLLEAAGSDANITPVINPKGSGIVRVGGLISFPQARLSLTSGVATTTSDVSGATTIYFGRGLVPIHDGTRFHMHDTGAELALALDSNSGHTNYHQSGKNYDLFVINDAGTIRLGSGPKWDDGAGAGSNTARGTGANSTELELKNGVWTNKNTITIRYGANSGDTVSVAANKAAFLGSFRTIANGQAGDTALKRFLSNAYNQVPRLLQAVDQTDQATYSTAAYQQYTDQNAATYQVEVLSCLDGILVDLHALAVCANSTSTFREVNTGIGIDSSTVDSTTQHQWGNCNNADLRSVEATYKGYPGIGYHALRWLQRGAGADTQTWYGKNVSAGGRRFTPGLNGTVWG